MTSNPNTFPTITPQNVGAMGAWGPPQQNRASPSEKWPPNGPHGPQKLRFSGFFACFPDKPYVFTTVVFILPIPLRRQHNL